MKTSITLTAFILIFVTAIYYASVQSDKQYCRSLQLQAKNYVGFEISLLDNEMCEQLELPVESLIQ